MTECFYHLDRLGELSEDSIFELSFTNAHPAGPTHKLDGHGIYENVGRDDYDTVEEYFPGGLSGHGKNYLYKLFEPSMHLLSNPQKGLDSKRIIELFQNQNLNNNWVKELVFDLVRRDVAKDELSRFQSVFGAGSMEDLESWMNLPSVNADSGDVYRVQTKSYSVRDATLLDLSGSYRDPVTMADDLKKQARRYWNGETSSNPVCEVLLEPEVEVVEYVDSIE